jgi:hypothetical protein
MTKKRQCPLITDLSELERYTQKERRTSFSNEITNNKQAAVSSKIVSKRSRE